MKIKLLISLTLLLTASVAHSRVDASLTVSPNPVIVRSDQIQGSTTLSWTNEEASGVICVSIDHEEEVKLKEVGAEGTLEVTVELGKTYVYNLYSGDKERLLASVTVTVVQEKSEPPPSQLPPIAPPSPDVYPAYIYALTQDGTLKWYRHDGAQDGKATWQGPRDVATGWNKYKFVFPGGGNIIYAITQDGILQWYRHKGFETGLGSEVPGSWEGPNDVGRGWDNLKQVFSGGDGIIYVVNRDDKLLWFRHNAILSGAGLETPGAWDGPKEVGRGWGNLRAVFSTGGGVIYDITQNGKLQWYKHNGYLTGRGLETAGAWSDRIELGPWSSSTTFKQLFSAGHGIIYDLELDGTLKWSRHLAYDVGYSKPFLPPEAFGNFGNKDWLGTFQIGRGWASFTQVFALLPNADNSGVVPVDKRSTAPTGTRPGVRSTLNPQPPLRRTPNSVRQKKPER